MYIVVLQDKNRTSLYDRKQHTASAHDSLWELMWHGHLLRSEEWLEITDSQELKRKNTEVVEYSIKKIYIVNAKTATKWLWQVAKV